MSLIQYVQNKIREITEKPLSLHVLLQVAGGRSLGT